MKVFRATRSQRWLAAGAGMLCLVLTGCPATGHGDRMRVLNEDGVQQFAQGHYRDASESFEAALVLHPDDPALLFNLGQCQDRLGESKKAEAYYRECLAKNADHADARQALVTLLFRTGRAEDANRTIEAWLTDGKNRPDALVLDSWRLMQEKNYPQAHHRLQQALFIDPHHSRALIQLGIYHETLNQPDRALVCYERALERDPNQFEVRQRVQTLLARGVKKPLPEQ